MRQLGLLMIVLLLAGSAHAATLREVVYAELPGVELAQLEHADSEITSYGFEWNEERSRFGIAYYVKPAAPAQGTASILVHVAVYDANAQAWRKAELDQTGLGLVGNSVGLEFHHGRLYLPAHVNPSANVTYILDEDLTFIEQIAGHLIAVFPDNTVVFRNGQAHFSPTDHTTVSVRVGATGETRVIYPLEPYQAVRKARIDEVREVYTTIGEDWFRNNNHHLNPEWFHRYMPMGSAVSNEAANAFAFIEIYEWESRIWNELPLRYLFAKTLASAGESPRFAPSPSAFAEEVLAQPIWYTRLSGSLGMVTPENRADILRLFNGHPKLKALFEKTLDAPPAEFERNTSYYTAWFRDVDPAWMQPETLEAIYRAVMPRIRHQVAVIGRNPQAPAAYQYREIPLDEVATILGTPDPAAWLTPENLDKLFGP